MAANPKSSDPDREFTLKAKFIFGSTTGRIAPYAYFGVAPNLVILSNSTSPPPNKDHGDRIMSYSVGELGMHFIEFKDEDFLTQFKALLQIPDGIIWCGHVVNVISLLGKYKVKELQLTINDVGEYLLHKKGSTKIDKKNIVGFAIENFHVVSELFHWYKYVYSVGTPEHKKQYPWVEIPVETDPVMVGRVYFTEIDTDWFKHADGTPVFTGVRPKMQVMNIDGLSAVSLKECVKKLHGQEYSLTRYLWAVQNAYVLSVTRFENDMVVVRSIRPNVLSTPVSDSVGIAEKSVYAQEA